MAKFLDMQGLSHFYDKLKALLANKVDKVSGKGLSANDFTTAEKDKLASAQANIIEIIKVNGIVQSITSKSVDIDLSDYAKKSDITSVLHYKGQKDTVNALPSEGNVVGDMYNVKSTGANYVWDGTAWDKLSENVDLSVFYTKDEANATFATKGEIGENITSITDAEIDALFA